MIFLQKLSEVLILKADAVKKFNFIKSIVVFSVVLVFGIGFMFFAVKINNQKVPENYIETNATIVRIEEELSPTFDRSEGTPDAGDYEHTVFVDYTYNGNTYSNRQYANYDSSMKVGDTVSVFVDPDDPETFMCDTSGDYVFIIVSAVVILVGIGGIAYSVIKKKRG